MRHHPLMTGTPPFRIHPGDAPFVQPDKPWPSPNNRRMAAEAAAQGRLDMRDLLGLGFKKFRASSQVARDRRDEPFHLL